MQDNCGKTEFCLRKLHSISGLVPVGFFLLEHIWTNSHVMNGPDSFDKAVDTLQGLPFLIFLEICFIWLPILYHGLYGMYITFTGRPNVSEYPYMRNWLYLLQRITGILAFAFIIYHVVTMRLVTKTTDYQGVLDHLQNDAVMIVYVVGITATVFHFANGLWNLMVKWGITVGPKAQRTSGYLMTCFGILLLAVALVSLFHFQPIQPIK